MSILAWQPYQLRALPVQTGFLTGKNDERGLKISVPSKRIFSSVFWLIRKDEELPDRMDNPKSIPSFCCLVFFHFPLQLGVAIWHDSIHLRWNWKSLYGNEDKFQESFSFLLRGIEDTTPYFLSALKRDIVSGKGQKPKPGKPS